LAVHEGIMQDRFTAEHVIISAPKNAKPTCELQLPSMKKLMSNSSAQPYFLRTLKIFMQVRDMYEAQNGQTTGGGVGAGAVGDNDDDIIDIEGDGGASGGSSSDMAPGSASTISPPPPMETNQTIHDGDEDEEDDDDEPRASSGVGSHLPASAGKSTKPTLSQILCLDVLWHTLSECLVALEESKDEFAVLVSGSNSWQLCAHCVGSQSPAQFGRPRGHHAGSLYRRACDHFGAKERKAHLRAAAAVDEEAHVQLLRPAVLPAHPEDLHAGARYV